MITQLLHDLDNNNIQLQINKEKIKLIYEKNALSDVLKELIKRNKPKLITRLQENEAARKKGFMIYGNGALYEYRYGFGSYLYIERQSEELATVWRANYRKDIGKPYKVIILVQNTSFEKAYKDAVGFIDWLKRRR